MFGKRKVKIPVPGSPVVVVDEACHKQQVEETLRRNQELDEGNIDKTVADSFPASDPASSVPETKERPDDKRWRETSSRLSAVRKSRFLAFGSELQFKQSYWDD